MSELHYKQIGHEAGVASVAIRERVDLHQPVVKAHRDLIGLIGFVFDPWFGVVKQLAQRYGDLKVFNPEVALTGPEFSSPPPYVTEHLPVQSLHEFFT